MTCENCIHYSLCESQCRNQYENGECAYCYRYFCEVKNTAEKCPSFKDKSLYIKLPCKVGDTVYFITGIHRNIVKPATVEEIIINRFGVSDLFVSTDKGFFGNDFGIFFLTREAAEQALKEREQE